MIKKKEYVQKNTEKSDTNYDFIIYDREDVSIILKV